MLDHEATVGVRELRQNLSVYLRRVKAGETLRVTDHGQPVALLAPLPREMSARDRLIAEGRLIPGEGDLLALDLPKPYPLRMSTKAALDLEREERLG
jgi:prevent-host-death family protein